MTSCYDTNCSLDIIGEHSPLVTIETRRPGGQWSVYDGNEVSQSPDTPQSSTNGDASGDVQGPLNLATVVNGELAATEDSGLSASVYQSTSTGATASLILPTFAPDRIQLPRDRSTPQSTLFPQNPAEVDANVHSDYGVPSPRRLLSEQPPVQETNELSIPGLSSGLELPDEAFAFTLGLPSESRDDMHMLTAELGVDTRITRNSRHTSPALSLWSFDFTAGDVGLPDWNDFVQPSNNPGSPHPFHFASNFDMTGLSSLFNIQERTRSQSMLIISCCILLHGQFWPFPRASVNSAEHSFNC